MACRWICVLFAVLALAGSAPAAAPPVQIAFCPSDQARAYPLDDRGRMQGLLLQRFVIANRGVDPYDVREIRVALLSAGRAVDQRTIAKDDLQTWSYKATIKAETTDLCSDDVDVADGPVNPILDKDEALVVYRQPFAYDHARDKIEVAVQGILRNRPTTVSAALPLRVEFAKTSFIFPLRGTLYVGVGPSFHTGHRTTASEEFAIDIAKLGGDGSVHRGDGTKFADYYAYGLDVLAAADGRVVKTVDGRTEDLESLQRPGESGPSYMRRFWDYTIRMIAKGWDTLGGNYVVIDHGNGEYSFYAHLQPGSVRVREGEVVKVGDVIGKLGSSGNSTDPHLHFQVCDRPTPLDCAGIPVRFSNITILWAYDDRALQSGDIVMTH